jgi:hypothetical protein
MRKNTVSPMVSAALERLYPGVKVKLTWNDHSEIDVEMAYKGWHISFESSAPAVLVKHGLVASRADLNRGGNLSPDEFGHPRHAHGIIDSGRLYGVGIHIPEVIPEGPRGCLTEHRVHTKKMQRLVAGLLKKAFALPERGVSR